MGEAGSLALVIVLLLGTFFHLWRGPKSSAYRRRLNGLTLAIIPVTAFYVTSTLLEPNAAAFSNTVQLILVIGFMLGFSQVKWNRAALKPFFWVFTLILAAHLVWWILAGYPKLFQGFMAHPNGLGLFVLTLAFFPVLVYLGSVHSSVIRYVALASTATSFTLLYASGSRASWLAAGTMLAVLLAWPLITRTRLLFHAAFAFALSAALTATWFYQEGPDTVWGQQLQYLSVEYTGQNFFSGRQLFWGDLEQAIRERPWFGHGAGSIAESFTGYSWSSHNLYLQTSLQVGILGLASLVFMLWNIWGQMWQGRHAIGVRLSAAFLVGILVHQVFEVSLTQNNLANGFMIWLVLAIGLNLSWRAES